MELQELDDILSDSIEQYDRSLAAIKQGLTAYERRCAALIKEAGTAPSYSEADHLFDELLAIQTTMSKLLFGRGISIGKRLDKLTREFDRLDDVDERRYWFEKFQSGVEWPGDI